MPSDRDLTGGTYEILQNRLRTAAEELRSRLARLNSERSIVFGNIETKLLATERITTEHHCIPRDLIAISNHFLLGYNVQFGLKAETLLADVFAAYRLDGLQFHAEPLSQLLEGERFQQDFAELYRFYKHTTFQRFYTSGPFVYFVFQIGRTPQDIKAFKWQNADGKLRYIDSRSEHEVALPRQHELAWKRTTRDQHHYGRYPHISIEDRVFVETIGGDLTIKVENNTDSGAGIYSEPVDHADQTLDDAEIYYASLGNLVLLKVRPYQESVFRYLIFNAKLSTAIRMDEIESACLLLPDDQGIVFPGGYYLQTGDHRRFDHGYSRLVYRQTIAAPNGEDFLYLFSQPESSVCIQLRYNLIRQSMETPLVTSGQTFFADGEMVTFKSHDEPQRHHALQIWQTPFTSADRVSANDVDSFLFKIGNRDLVRGMAECSEILHLIDQDDRYDGLYVDLGKRCTDVLDSFYWINHPDTCRLDEPLANIRDAASLAVDEFERVLRMRREATDAVAAALAAEDQLLKQLRRGRFESIDDFVAALAELRKQRGQVIGLRELRYVDLQALQQLEQRIADKSTEVGQGCIDFLATPAALQPFRQRVTAAEQSLAGLTGVADARRVQDEIQSCGSQLELLTETVSNLPMQDAAQRTAIIDAISEVYAGFNRVRAMHRTRTQELMTVEGEAEFASQLRLLEQTVQGLLEVCDTPDKCDTHLSRVMTQLEELEGRFAEFPEFVDQLTQRREQDYAAFESRKVQLIEARNRRAETLAASAARVIQAVQNRAAGLATVEEILAYFAADLMVDKVNQLERQLRDLGDAVRADEIASRLKTVREDSVRQRKDRNELFEDGGDTIRLGKQRFSVNRQPLDVTMVVRDGVMCLHLTGTQYFRPIDDSEVVASRDLWDQPLVSENREVYRGEFLAMQWLQQWQAERRALPPDQRAGQEWLPDDRWVQTQLAKRPSEGYTSGVHDRDAIAILTAMWQLEKQLGLLRHSPTVRMAATYWWLHVSDETGQAQLGRWIGGFSQLTRVFPDAEPARQFRQQITQTIAASSTPADGWLSLFPGTDAEALADYWFDLLQSHPPQIVYSETAVQLYDRFCQSMTAEDRRQWVTEPLTSHRDQPQQAFVLARNWADAFIQSLPAVDGTPWSQGSDELAMLILQDGVGSGEVIHASNRVEIGGLLGDHPRIRQGKLTIDYQETLQRVQQYRDQVVPRFQRLAVRKHELLERARQQLRLEEYRPRVLTSFVRNLLIDEVYLPMIGDNLAKQIGASGAGKRTDRMGMLLLISPPGYGKTTLMEYVANRLGIVFVKINGPTIGHAVRSLDPAEAPNAAAREEIQRINLAFEMGDNVMLYLDDIQHTHSELLQKFISLCDGTRRIEGVLDGKTKTYDLRGRRFAVVMAGNPYTETGERFQIPDMLANRADVYNLGEIIGGAAHAFELSYLENCLTSNSLLTPLAAAAPEDARAMILAAQRGTLESLNVKANWSADQVQAMFAVLQKLVQIRDVVLKVNRAYIRSAAQADEYRTEPPFKLQGSYRNMNRLAEKVVPVMNDDELQALIVGTYEQDAQTLASDSESNLLKLRELFEQLTPEQRQRWDAIKYGFTERTKLKGISGDDQASLFLQQLASMRDGLESIRVVLASASESAQQRALQEAAARESAARDFAAAQQQAAALASPADPPVSMVKVQHAVPRVFLDLVRGQFHLMQEWLRPLLEGSQGHGRELQQVKQKLDELSAIYVKLQKDLQDNESSL